MSDDKNKNRWILLAALLVTGLSVFIHYKFFTPDTLGEIYHSKKLTVITDNSANTYYIYRDKPMGFEYDLAKAFADYLGVELEVITPGWNMLFEALNNKEGHLVAAGLTATDSRREFVDFSNEYLPIQQQVVIYKDNNSIREIDDLNGKKIYVRRGTSYQSRLFELMEEGLGAHLVLIDDIPTEELIQQVANKEIEITVADSNIALLNRRYYPDVKIAFPINEEEHLAWAVRKGDKRFCRKINTFLKKIQRNGVYDQIYERYYGNVEFFDYVDLKKFHIRIKTRISKYVQLIREEARKYNFDWRMIAAMVYQESHFNPKAISHTGVRGMMQVTLDTAKEMGIDNRLDPEQSIRGGVKYLSKLYNRFDDIEDLNDRILFALAGYNIGYGHVRDAQILAADQGLDPVQWRSVQETLPLLMKREHYKKTKYGYARGTEPVKYVERILVYYDILKRQAHGRKPVVH
ncbi:MAG: membrane-bound lytic murein transglycosylase MltF [Desulfobacterales bacterium]|nr:membrane-bound lytic murein transglycosylase MltF [Desulfobacterales bacterium]